MNVNPTVFRMLKFFVVFVLVVHFIACSFWYIARHGDYSSSWAPDRDQYADAPMGDKYAKALVFALAVMYGNEEGAQNTIENVFMSLCYMIALVVNAVIIGSVNTLLANMDHTAVAKKTQMDGVNEYMRFRKV
ncbi:unnamed protein product, partial [Phaeothamnion confervicola]